LDDDDRTTRRARARPGVRRRGNDDDDDDGDDDDATGASVVESVGVQGIVVGARARSFDVDQSMNECMRARTSDE